jgi:signal transduction histidine kinase
MVFATLAFIAIGGAVIAFSYYSMLHVIDAQIDGTVSRESADLTAAYERGGYGVLRQAIAYRAQLQLDAQRVYLLEGPDGTVTGNLRQWPAEAPEPGRSKDIEIPHPAKAARVRTFAFPEGSRLILGRALTERTNFRKTAGESLLFVLAADLLLGAAAGILLARYAGHRLGRINAAAQEVLDGNLSGRVAVGTGRDEYDHLAQTINAMLDRIQRLMTTVRGVTENIAHDLRTPLNRLHGRLETALLSLRTPEEYRDVLKRAIAESETIVGTFNAILKIARIETGAFPSSQAPIDLTKVARDLVDLYQAFAEDSGISLEARLPSHSNRIARSVFVLGDLHLISQAAANLLDNAIKYSPAGSKAVIAVMQDADGASLTVADDGPGIPATKRTAILDRFVRLETANGKEGFGLGLSFVSAVAEWHGARLELTDNKPGLRAALLFPAGTVQGKAPATQEHAPARSQGLHAVLHIAPSGLPSSAAEAGDEGRL